MKRGPPVDNCRLCNRLQTLKDSHILPKWSYERILRGPEGRQPAPVFMDASTKASVLTNKQISEYLLCHDCEQLFCRWEKYLSTIVVQEDNSFPWLDTVSAGSHARRPVDSSALDIETIVRFAYSVAWRGSVCSELPPYLGSSYERKIGDYLQGSSGSLPHETCVSAYLLTEKSLQRCVIPPQSHRWSGCHMHWFVVCGVQFHIVVGGCLPASARDACMSRSRRAVISDGAALKKRVAPSVLTFSPRGKLAKMDAKRG